MNYDDISKVLKDIRMSNMNNVIIGHLTVNSIAGKFDSLKLIIPENLEIMVTLTPIHSFHL